MEVYGTISNERGGAPIKVASSSAYDIDGSRNGTFDPPIPSDVQYQQLLYQSPTLENTQHILTITSLVSDSAFWLDYFKVGTASTPLPGSRSTGILLTSTDTSTPPSINQPKPSASTPASSNPGGRLIPSGGTSRESSITPTIHPQPSTTQNGTSLSSPSSNTKGARINKGLIAGATIGSVVVIVLLVIVIWAKFGRKARRSSSLDVQPFIYPNRAQILLGLLLTKFIGFLGDGIPSLSALERNQR